MSTLREHVGKRLRELRKARGLAQSELGLQPRVSDHERGKRDMLFSTVEEYAARLHCDPLELFR